MLGRGLMLSSWSPSSSEASIHLPRAGLVPITQTLSRNMSGPWRSPALATQRHQLEGSQRAELAISPRLPTTAFIRQHLCTHMKMRVKGRGTFGHLDLAGACASLCLWKGPRYMVERSCVVVRQSPGQLKHTQPAQTAGTSKQGPSALGKWVLRRAWTELSWLIHSLWGWFPKGRKDKTES